MSGKDFSSHDCEAVVLHCIDFRFNEELDNYFDKQFPEGYDLISIAGSCKGLLQDEEHRKFLLEQFQISHRLHHPKTIALVQHEDCGAYEGSKSFSDEQKEQKFHRQEFLKAEKLLSIDFPEMYIEGYYAKLSGGVTTF
tara:strand:- start:255 stop:671 length:417 start_codon:yes stop_codon:yes gene_type:complete